MRQKEASCIRCAIRMTAKWRSSCNRFDFAMQGSWRNHETAGDRHLRDADYRHGEHEHPDAHDRREGRRHGQRRLRSFAKRPVELTRAGAELIGITRPRHQYTLRNEVGQKGGVSSIWTNPATGDLSATRPGKKLTCFAEKPTPFLRVYCMKRKRGRGAKQAPQISLLIFVVNVLLQR